VNGRVSSLLDISLGTDPELTGKVSKKSSGKKSSGKKVAAKKTTTKKVVVAKQTGPAPVPESLLKKQKTQAAIKVARETRATAALKAARLARRVAYKNARAYATEYQNAEKQLIRLKRQAKNAGHFYKADEAKVLLVVRIRGINRMAPKTKKILQLLRLRQIHNAVFLKVNKATMNMLRLVEPYVTYGEPTVKTVRDLVYKRGFGKVNKQRIPLSHNKIVAQNLGEKGIVCVEDLIHEIFTCGDNFKAANNFLWPFKLSSPLGGYQDKGTHYSEGGDAGNRAEHINQFVRRMN
jgi:large subunit ribosomal protein L7e